MERITKERKKSTKMCELGKIGRQKFNLNIPQNNIFLLP